MYHVLEIANLSLVNVVHLDGSIYVVGFQKVLLSLTELLMELLICI